MAFYQIGEQKNRPGVYLRIANRGADIVTASPLPVTPPQTPDSEPPVETDGLLVSYDGSNVVTLTLPEGSTENNPDNAPTLWEDINYKEGYRIIPDTITVGTAFALNEYGWWNGTLYKSLLDTNVYTPEQYAAGWEIVQ